MAPPVRVRRLTEQEGQKLQHIVRRGSTSSVLFRRAMMLPASAGGSTVPVVARLVQADEDTVRDAIHRFNEIGLACFDLQWAGGRPCLLNDDDEDFVAQTATTRPTLLGKPFTRWSIRKLADHLRRNGARPIRIGREALRCLLTRHGITFQRTKTWKESPDPDIDAKPARIEYAVTERPGRTFAFDEFGPLGIRPPPAPAGPRRTVPTGCRRPTAVPRASPTSTAAPPSATTRYGSSTGTARASTIPGRLCDRCETAQTRALHPYPCWRNNNARHPDVLAAQRRERARGRGEKGIRWGGRPLPTAA